MADEQGEGNSPMSTSEATPPHEDDSPEMISQPSPPEEQRVTSSSDSQPAAIADSPEEPSVSSTSEQEPNDDAGPSNEEPAVVRFLLASNEAARADAESPASIPNQSPSDPAPEMENRPPSGEPQTPALRRLLEDQSAVSGRDEPCLSTVGEAEIRAGLAKAVAMVHAAEAGLATAVTGGQTGSSKEITKGRDEPCLSTVGEAEIRAGLARAVAMVHAAVEARLETAVTGGQTGSSKEITKGRDEPCLSTVEAEIRAGLARAVAMVQAAAAEARLATAVTGGQTGSSKEITKSTMKQNVVDLKSDDYNEQFDVEDLSPESKSSGENVDLESDSSSTGLGFPEQERGSRRGATEDIGVESDSCPEIVILEEDNSLTTDATKNVKSEQSCGKADATILGSGVDTTEKVGLKSELSSKTRTTVQVTGPGATENVALGSKLSPSKTGVASIEGSTSADGIPENLRNALSPKRKSPSKLQHLSPKRSSPYTSPDKFQKQGDSHMSTLLEDLDIKETKDRPESSDPISGYGQDKNKEIKEFESRKETEQESSMEVQESGSQKDGETTEYSKNDDSDMDAAD